MRWWIWTLVLAGCPKKSPKVATSGERTVHEAVLPESFPVHAPDCVDIDAWQGLDEAGVDAWIARCPLDGAAKKGLTLTLQAYRAKRLDLVAMLVEKGADLNHSPVWGTTVLHEASGYEPVEVLEELVRLGADPYLSAQSMTPLHYAAMNGNVPALRYFQGLGLPLDTPSKDGRTALIFAAQSSDEAVAYLVGAGAEVNAKNKDGRTALIQAAQSGHAGAVDILLEAGADTGAAFSQRPFKGTAVTVALSRDHPQIAKRIAERANHVPGQRELETLVKGDHVEALALLMPRRDATSPNDQALAKVAVRDCAVQSLAWLLAHGQVALDRVDPASNSTLLHDAVWSGKCPGVVTALLEAGADTTVKDAMGKTALEGARSDAFRALFEGH